MTLNSASTRPAAPPRPFTSIIRRPLLLATLAAFPLLGACDGEGTREFRSIGTGGTGGVYYPLGGALANQLSLVDTVRQYTAEVTGGSVENVNRVLRGQIDLGFALSVTAYRTWNEASEDDPGRRLRVVAPLYPNLIHIMVRDGAGVEGLADLRGKRVSVGSPGSGTEQSAREILASAGLDYEAVDEQFLSFSESASALKDGALDAAILSVGYPAAAVLEATTTGSVGLLALDPEEVGAISTAYPYYDPASIPGGVYPGAEEAVPTVAMMNWIVSRDDLPHGIATAVLNIMSGEGVSLERVHPMAGQIDISALGRAPAPLHPAAENWR